MWLECEGSSHTAAAQHEDDIQPAPLRRSPLNSPTQKQFLGIRRYNISTEYRGEPLPYRADTLSPSRDFRYSIAQPERTAVIMARVYADVNQQMPRSYWDYDSVNISWGVLENYEVVRKIGQYSILRRTLVPAPAPAPTTPPPLRSTDRRQVAASTVRSLRASISSITRNASSRCSSLSRRRRSRGRSRYCRTCPVDRMWWLFLMWCGIRKARRRR